MENTLENKAKFFGQYTGQKVCNYYDLINLKRTCHINEFSSHRIYESYLELKPLSSITDEDAVEDAYLHWPYYRDTAHNVDCTWLKNILETISKHSLVADYLRSKGYALPYMGLSVEQLVEYRWIKLSS